MSKIKFQESIQNIQAEIVALYKEVNPSSTSIQLNNIAYFAQDVIARSPRQKKAEAQTKYDACQRILRLYDLHVKMLAIDKKIEEATFPTSVSSTKEDSTQEETLLENTPDKLYEKLTELCDSVLETRDNTDIPPSRATIFPLPRLSGPRAEFISSRISDMHEAIRNTIHESPRESRIRQLKAFAKGEAHPLVLIPTLLFAAAIGVLSAFGGAPVGIAFFACMGILVHLGTLAGTYSYYFDKPEKHKELHDALDAGEKAVKDAAYGANRRRVPVQAEDVPQQSVVNAHELSPVHPNPVVSPSARHSSDSGDDEEQKEASQEGNKRTFQ